LYEDPESPERVTGTVESPEWTPEDRALLLALQQYESTLCPGPCGQPRHSAWQTDGWHKTRTFTCDACTAMARADSEDASKVAPVRYTITWLDPAADIDDLGPLTYGEATAPLLEDATTTQE
jgi:CDGSH-type Zn-finger protein